MKMFLPLHVHREHRTENFEKVHKENESYRQYGDSVDQRYFVFINNKFRINLIADENFNRGREGTCY